jgi:aryl-alcohol dehydrogenase-like predicted oxidoreductase
LVQLRTHRLDILLLHRPDPLWEREEIAEAFGKLHKAGKARCRCSKKASIRAGRYAYIDTLRDLKVIIELLENDT